MRDTTAPTLIRASSKKRAAFVPAAAFLCTVALGAPSAQANGFDVFGVGSRSAAMGGIGAATADDYTAAYYNPAAMVLGTSAIGTGFFATVNDLGIALMERPAGYDIPDLGSSGPAIASSRRFRDRSDLDGLDSSIGVFVGATTDLGLERFRMGATGMLPITQSAEQLSIFNDEREQYFTNQLHFDLIGSRVDHAAVAFGAAYQIFDWISVGAALSFMPSADTRNFVYADNLADLSDIDINVGLSLSSTFSAILGALFQLTDDFCMGLVFHDSQWLKLTGVTEVQVRGLQDTPDSFPFQQRFDITLQYSPRQFVWGGSWDVPGRDLLVAVDVVYSVWSDYRDNHGAVAGFNDVFSPRLGVELTPFEGHTFRAGGRYEPTPVGPQTGRTNYVDNDRIVASLGSGHAIAFNGSTLRLSWHLQVHYLLERVEVKQAQASYPPCIPGATALCDEVPDDAIDRDTGQPYPEAAGLQTGNPGFPGFASGGWLAHAGIEVKWEF